MKSDYNPCPAMVSPLSSVQTSLRALRAFNEGLEIDLEGQIVTRADRNTFPQQVKIISGGGAGHEPGHVGFVGRALLTTAISGAIFTSPPVQMILRGILLTGPKDSSILLIVTNYSGDRLNFALAEKMARIRYGYENIRTILVADDVALDTVPGVGCRGLAGTILIHKIAGAMADLGKSLEEVHSFCEMASKNLKTIGLSFDVDWSRDPRIKNVEIGKGVHGEPGAFKFPDQKDFTEIVQFVTDKFRSITASGTPVVLLLNNLGGPAHAFQLICSEIIDQLGFLRLVKVVAGTFFTSLGNSGASVTLLELPRGHELEMLSYIEYETDLFKENFHPARIQSSFIQPQNPMEDEEVKATGVTVDGERMQEILQDVCEKIRQHRSALNEMDLEFGDGDTGDTLSRGAAALLEYIASSRRDQKLFQSPFATFQTISHLLSCKMGGTSGALLGIFFESAAEAFKTTGFESPLWLQLGNSAITHAGQSKRGDRTMLDVLLAVQDSLEGVSVVDKEFLIKLKAVCRDTVESTKAMIPGSGRAVYNRGSTLAAKSVHPDPGAALIELIVTTVVNRLTGHH